MTLGERIKKARLKIGAGQKDFAEQLEINNTYLCTVEGDGRRPSIKLIKKISDLTDTPMDLFIKYYY